MNQSDPPRYSGRRVYTKVPKNLSKMTDAQIDDWANELVDQLMSVVGDNFSTDEETASEEVNMGLPIYLSDPGFFSPWFLGADHPTQGSRYSNVKLQFADLTRATGINVVQIDPRTATREELLRVHSPRYVEQVVDRHERFNPADNDPEQAILASAMVGATLQLLDVLLAGMAITAINFAGAKHHAQYDEGSGFCVFNDLAIAATIATQDKGLKVAIFDVDAHHGDGTENLTRSNPGVLTYSVHHFGIFPGTGRVSESANHVHNMPLISGDGDTKLMEATQEFLSLVDEYKPDLVFIAAGADGHVTDLLTGLEYTVAGYEECARTLRKALPTMPILIGGAGGYQPDDITPEIWAKFALQIALSAKDLSTRESE